MSDRPSGVSGAAWTPQTAPQHTPAPWRAYEQAHTADPRHIYWQIDGGAGHLSEFSADARGFGLSGYISEPDARLIAAAPDLLEALKALLPYFEGEHHPDHPDVVAARAAIAKAERG